MISAASRALPALPSCVAGDHDLLLRAVEIYEVDRLDFAEAYLVALAEESDVKRVASFDRQIDRVKSVQREP
jgi:predicted nucleic acid-binding protein